MTDPVFYLKQKKNMKKVFRIIIAIIMISLIILMGYVVINGLKKPVNKNIPGYLTH